MIRSRRCYNLAALAESEDPADLAQSHRIGSSVGTRVKPPYNFHVNINAKLNQVVIALSPNHTFEEYLNDRKWKEAFRDIGLDYDNYKDQIASHVITFFNLQTTRERAVIIAIQFKSDYHSEVIRYGREIQVALRIEQNRRAGLSGYN